MGRAAESLDSLLGVLSLPLLVPSALLPSGSFFVSLTSELESTRRQAGRQAASPGQIFKFFFAFLRQN